MSDFHGKFLWYEIMTTDVAAAKSFYSAVVGWTTTDMSMPGMTYTIFQVGESGVAGLMTLPPGAGAAPAWIGYIGVNDVDEYAEKVAAAGGTVHKAPADIPTVGRFSVVLDPHGAFFILFKPSMAAPSVPPPAPGTPGTAGWHELMAGDGAAAFDFYSGLFGWSKGPGHDMGPMGLYQIFEIDGKQAGGMMTKPPQMPAPFWGYYFTVDGIDAATERIKSAGGQVANGPMEVPGGQWIVQGIDPQGAYFNLVSNTK